MTLASQSGTFGGSTATISYTGDTIDTRLWLFVVTAGRFNGTTFGPDVVPDTPTGWTLEHTAGPVPSDPSFDPTGDLSNAYLTVFSSSPGVATPIVLTFPTPADGVYMLYRSPTPLRHHDSGEPAASSFTEDFAQTAAGSDLLLVMWSTGIRNTDSGTGSDDSTEWDYDGGVASSAVSLAGRGFLEAWVATVDPPATTFGAPWSAQPRTVQQWTFLEFGAITARWRIGSVGWPG